MWRKSTPSLLILLSLCQNTSPVYFVMLPAASSKLVNLCPLFAFQKYSIGQKIISARSTRCVIAYPQRVFRNMIFALGYLFFKIILKLTTSVASARFWSSFSCIEWFVISIHGPDKHDCRTVGQLTLESSFETLLQHGIDKLNWLAILSFIAIRPTTLEDSNISFFT